MQDFNVRETQIVSTKILNTSSRGRLNFKYTEKMIRKWKILACFQFCFYEFTVVATKPQVTFIRIVINYASPPLPQRKTIVRSVNLDTINFDLTKFS